MSGKLCTGIPENNSGAARINQSKSFCDGVFYRSRGVALARPITDNPHPVGSPNADSWDAGWTAADDAAGGNDTDKDKA